MKEKTSAALGLKYVVIDGNYITEEGVKFTVAETVGKDAKSICAMHAQRKKEGKLYDYVYAKNNGYIRARRDYESEIATRTEKVSKTAENAPEIPLPKEGFKITIVGVFRVVMLCVGALSMFMLILYSRAFQLEYLSPFGATVLAITMTVFATAAFEAVFLFWKRQMYGFAVMFSFLWLLVAAFSMASTMSVNFSRYTEKREVSFAENKEVNSGRLQLDSIAEKKKLNQEELDAAKATLTEYQQKEKQYEWQTNQYKSAISRLTKERKALIDDEIKIKENTPDSVLKSNATKVTFYDYLGKLWGIEPDFLQFILSILPALFLDLIAPFSVAISIFLEDEDGRDKKKA